ncbi:TonB-dependent receptor plug domain-containing protein [Candidatus Rariloculus sp.]|uniref:TonB-dependent receptor plug domain-containing protein n=1 Tax=Candidatus Rariloculus sp. TaxID=3101265 RepID=UPI003D0CCF95
MNKYTFRMPVRRLRLSVTPSSRSWLPAMLAALAAGFGTGPAVLAQPGSEGAGDGADGPNDTDAGQILEEVVTIGTRRAQRAATETPVPVDVFSLEEIESVNSSDLVDVINTIVPSFNVARQPISDGATFVRPTSLRGLDSHHTLVLINGRRRHRAALVQLGGFGAHGPDIGNIPTIALQSVEVLRDGAAAQYGSDAIAGVINFNLKSDDSGFDLVTRLGGYTEGDGEEATIEANAGFPLGDGGFINVSGQYSDTQPTNRSQPYDLTIGSSGQTPLEATRNQLTVDGVSYYGPDAFTYTYAPDGTIVQILPGSDGIPDDLDTRFAGNFSSVGGPRDFESPAQIWGQPRRDQALLMVNAALPLAAAVELYGYGNYADRDQAGGFFYRRPGVSQLLPLRLEDGSIYDPRTSLYPSGFTPFFSAAASDYSIALGMRGEFGRGPTYDVSLSYGNHELRYRLENTLNPSLGPATPTAFRPGDLVSDEFAAGADFTWPLDVGLASPLHLAFGFEYREEGYAIKAGDNASSAVGPFAMSDPYNFEITRAEVDADPNDPLTVIECRIPGFRTVGSLCPAGDPIHNVVPVGSNGFPGYSRQFTSDLVRDSYAGYIDVEWDVNPDWLVNAAARFESFSDFGRVAIGKLAMRYRATDRLNLRGSAGTGFRAPTPGQISTTNVSTRVNERGLPVAEGIFPPGNPAATLFGAQPLDAEDSRSVTLGLAMEPLDGLSVTLDYYRIELADRIVLSSQYAVGPDEVRHLEALGVPGANTIAQVRFFTNDVDSQTRGIDLVATWDADWLGGSTTLQAAFNRNMTKLTERGRFVDDEADHDSRYGAPATRGVVSMRQAWNRLDLLVRGSYFGDYANAATASLDEIQRFGSTFLVDVEATWALGDRYRVKIGAHNLFDTYPDAGEFEACCGRIYRSDSLIPWQGTSVYLQFAASWF